MDVLAATSGVTWYENLQVTNSVNTYKKDNPAKFKLFDNYPNPFNPTTKIKYLIPKASFVKLKVFDLLGNEITTLVSEEKAEGNYEITFDGVNLTSGTYFYKIQAGDFIKTKKLILLK